MNFPFFSFKALRASFKFQASSFIFHNGKIGIFSENRKFMRESSDEKNLSFLFFRSFSVFSVVPLKSLKSLILLPSPFGEGLGVRLFHS